MSVVYSRVENELTHTAGVQCAAFIRKAALHIVSHPHTVLSLCGAEEQVSLEPVESGQGINDIWCSLRPQSLREGNHLKT